MENNNKFDQTKHTVETQSPESQLPLMQPPPVEPEDAPQQPRIVIYAILVALLILILVGGSIYVLAHPNTDTAKVRDIFIIFMALESLLIGFALVILMVQLARLINLMQNEIKPILDSTQDTLGHLRGTTVFLSENLVEPVIKLNEYMAGFSQLLQVIGFGKKVKRTKTSKGE
jgi:hypothetical protein